MPLAFVAGANGAIGRYVVAALYGAGWRVAGLGHGPATWAGDSPVEIWRSGEVSQGNLDLLADQVGNPDLVVNLASGASVWASIDSPLDDFERTVSTAVRLLSWMRHRAPGARLVAVSSAAVYGNAFDRQIEECDLLAPVSPYGHHKVMMEQAVRYWGGTYGVPSAIVRPFSVYGPGLNKQLIFDLCSRLVTLPRSLVLDGTGAEMRDLIHIRDAAAAIVHLAEYATAAAPVWNVCTGAGVSVREVVKRLADAAGAGTQIDFNGRTRAGDPKILVGSPEKLAKSGFLPRVHLDVGLLEMLEYVAASKGGI